MPSRKEVQWSQLKVGLLVVAALVALTGLVFLMSSTTGGLFAQKLTLRCYVDNAAGIKVGAPVTLEGVTIGNIAAIRIMPSHNPTPVEISMKVGEQYKSSLHTDTKASIAQAGVLGDSFLDLDSAHATGPEPQNNAELPVSDTPKLQDVIASSQASVQMLGQLIGKLNTLVDSLNSKNGTLGLLINDPALYQKLLGTIAQLQGVATSINQGQGSLGKLVKDDTLYTHLNDATEHLDNITKGIDAGEGTAGKLVKDDALYQHLNQTITNANELLAGINQGQGTLGKLAKDPAMAAKLESTITSLNLLLDNINQGKGTLGQLATNRALYDNANGTLTATHDLIQAVRENPKKYLTIHFKLF